MTGVWKYYTGPKNLTNMSIFTVLLIKNYLNGSSMMTEDTHQIKVHLKQMMSYTMATSTSNMINRSGNA